MQAARNQKIATPDAIVIGAGVNALGAAYLLGRAGWRVLVLERNSEPGGAIRTRELTLPGFRHDIGATNLNVLANSPFFKEHAEALASKGFELIRADYPVGTIFPDGRFLGITTDPEANLRAIAAFSPADVEAWKTWRADFDRCIPFLSRIFSSPFGIVTPSGVQTAKAVTTDAAAPSGIITGLINDSNVRADIQPVLRAILTDSIRENLTARFESEAVRAMLAAWGMHPDYAPDVAGGVWMPFLESNADERGGIAIGKGGAGRLTQALTELVVDLGGQIWTEQPVERIVIEDGRAVGVQLVGGEEIRALKAVVAGVTPTALLNLTGGQLPEPEAARAREWRYGPGTFMIHLALSGLPDWIAEGARRSFYVHIGPSLDHIAAAYEQGMAGLLPAEPFCVVAQPTLFDPSRAPAGKHVLWIMVRAVPAEIRGDAAGESAHPIQDRTWTPAVKQAFANRVLDVVESYAPGLRAKILGMAVQSPPDLEAWDSNLVGGDLCAGSQHLDQFYGNRPFPGNTSGMTSILGLYMCGASTWPGSGATPASGVMLAQMLVAGYK